MKLVVMCLAAEIFLGGPTSAWARGPDSPLISDASLKNVCELITSMETTPAEEPIAASLPRHARALSLEARSPRPTRTRATTRC
jgi:hypothetical protein